MGGEGCASPNNNILDGKIHGANMGPTWVLSAPDGMGPMLAPWTLLTGMLWYGLASGQNTE